MVTLADLARRLNSRHGRGHRPPALVLMTDSRRLPDPAPAIMRLPADAMVVFRHYEDPDREAKAAALLVLCRRRRLPLLVAGDWRLAARLGADGVHLPEALAGAAAAIRRRRRWRVTAAAHSEAALRRAADAGVDAVLLSPVFATRSHPGARTLGPRRFARLVRQVEVPVYALGGVDRATAPRLLGSGAVGIAAIGGLARAQGR
ncbi:MAG: thiamine phosphate synthase [Alphaproteobacteria bacterium]|jgi:thiamine-phosphate pyrophosphorylase|nr:thiamine phosphate synthase [Alphaproteobacteria bacterium]